MRGNVERRSCDFKPKCSAITNTDACCGFVFAFFLSPLFGLTITPAMRPRAAFALPWASLLLAAEGILCAYFVRETPATRDETFTCVSVRSDRWNLLPGVELTGRLRLQLAPAPAGAMTLIVGDSIPLDLEAHAAGGATVPLHREEIHATAAPPDFWLEYGTPWNAP